MNRRIVLGTLLCVLALVGWATDKAVAAQQHAHGHFDKCAKACTDCLRECEACAHHCALMVADGKKEHLKTLGTCADCGDFCALAAKVVSRHGPMAIPTCEACARACDICGAACEKFPDDDHMKRCDRACRDCAKACREMVMQAGQDKK